MAGSNPIPERLTNFRIYDDENNILGVATIDLPEIAFMTETVSGAGISGEVETPVAGHFQAMSCTINWRTIEPQATKLSQSKVHTFDCRGSQRIYDASNAVFEDVPIRCMMKVVPKTYSIGTLDVGKTTSSSGEYEVLYLKLSYDGEEVAEIDKYNFVAKFNGEDLLEKVRQDLGMA